MDRLGYQIALETLDPAFAAKARILDPAKWRIGNADRKCVDTDHARFDRIAEQIGAPHVLGKGKSGESVWQAVGLGNCIVEG